MIKPLLVVDEFVFIMTNKWLIKSKSERYYLKWYIAVTDKCRKDPTFENCSEICEDLNLNKRSFIYDLNTKLFLHFRHNYIDEFLI